MDIITGGKLSSILIAICPAFIGRAVYPVGGEGKWEGRYLAGYKVDFIRVHDNPSTNKSIVTYKQ